MAEALTVHKSQGQSMAKLVIDFGLRAMDIAMLYVAFTRAKVLQGLYLLGKFKPPTPRKSTDPVVLEMERLERECKLEPRFAFLRLVPQNVLQVMSHNVQSIRKHLPSIISDQVYMNSDLLLFQETWALDNEEYPIEGFTEICRNNYSGPTVAQGTLIYSKSASVGMGLVTPARVVRKDSGGKHVDVTSCTWNNILFLNVYKNPGATLSLFSEAIDEFADEIESKDHVFLLGDLNANFREENEYERYLENFAMKLLSDRQKPTTNANTVIDCVFGKTSNLNYQCHVYESFFSLHKPLILRVPIDM